MPQSRSAQEQIQRAANAEFGAPAEQSLSRYRTLGRQCALSTEFCDWTAAAAPATEPARPSRPAEASA